MKVFKLVTTVMSLAIAGLGVVGVVAPAVLLESGRSLLAPPVLYCVAAVRVVFGARLILVATESRMPRTLQVIGIFIVVAGLLAHCSEPSVSVRPLPGSRGKRLSSSVPLPPCLSSSGYSSCMPSTLIAVSPPNTSIERTDSSKLRLPPAAAYVER
jgi:hypothetical protein